MLSSSKNNDSDRQGIYSRFKVQSVTQTDFFLNKRELQSYSKTPCAEIRLAGVEESDWISIFILKVFLYSQCVGRCPSPATLATSTIHVSYMTWLKTHTNRHTPTCNKEPGHCFVCMSVADSPRSLDGLRDTVTVCQDPHRQPWEKKLNLTPLIPRWMVGGHAVMRRKGWRRGNRPGADCEDGEISTSATAATQTGRI